MSCLGWILAAFSLGFWCAQYVEAPRRREAITGWQECLETASAMHRATVDFRRSGLVYVGDDKKEAKRRGVGGPKE